MQVKWIRGLQNVSDSTLLQIPTGDLNFEIQIQTLFSQDFGTLIGNLGRLRNVRETQLRMENLECNLY